MRIFRLLTDKTAYLTSLHGFAPYQKNDFGSSLAPTIAMAKVLKIKIIDDGVEAQAQLEFLQHHGWDIAVAIGEK